MAARWPSGRPAGARARPARRVAGVGKTRLASEALARARRTGRQTAWVGATRSAASIPFGAVSHLLPAGEHFDLERWEVLRWAADELARRAGPDRLVLGVDDAHLLDDASAALVYQLVTRSLAVVVATIRSGEPAPTRSSPSGRTAWPGG
jgi:hypothetical protein